MATLPELKMANPLGTYLGTTQNLQEMAYGKAQEKRSQEAHEMDMGLKTLAQSTESELAKTELDQKKRNLMNDIYGDIGAAASYIMGLPKEAQPEAFNKALDFYESTLGSDLSAYRDRHDLIPMMSALGDENQREMSLEKMKATLDTNKEKGSARMVELKGGKGPIAVIENEQGRLIDAQGNDVTGQVVRFVGTRQQVEQGEPGSFDKTKSQTGKAITDLENNVISAVSSFRGISNAFDTVRSNPNSLGTVGGMSAFINEFGQGLTSLYDMAGFDRPDIEQEISDFKADGRIDGIFRDAGIKSDDLKSLLVDVTFLKAKSLDPAARVTDNDFKIIAKSLGGKTNDPVAFMSIMGRQVEDIKENTKKRIQITQIPDDQKERLLNEIDSSYQEYFPLDENPYDSYSVEDLIKALTESPNEK